jgi:hypothetical protein
LAAFAQVGELKNFSHFEWTQGSEAFIFEVDVEYYDVISINLACDPGQYIKDCGRPEILDSTKNIPFTCAPTVSSYETTENFCYVVAPYSGKVSIAIPVLQRGIRYSGTAEVTEGP